MFIEPIIVKANNKPFKREEKVENLKTYVVSNVQKYGKGPEAWRSTTRLAQQEIFGAYTQAKVDDEKPVASTNVEDESGLEEAISDSDEVHLSLSEDLSLTKSISVPSGKNVTINLNGKTVTTFGNQTGFVADGGEITITNGTITGQGRAAVAQNGGKLVINGGKFKTTREGQVMNATGEGSQLVINDGEFEGQEFAVMAFDGAEVVINGGDFETIDNAVIGTNGSAGRGNNKIVINNATLTGKITTDGYEACGVYVANNDEVIIGSNVEINVTNGCGILMRGGNVTVKKGAKIITTTDKGNDFTGYVGDNKTKMSQSGIIYHEIANYPGKAGMKLTVESGVKISSIAHSIEILSNEQTPNVLIRQGDFSPAYPEE